MSITAPALWLKPALMWDPWVEDRLIVLDGWEERGRPGTFLPSGVIQHHTACMCRARGELRPDGRPDLGHDPQSCINGILAGNSVAPGPVSQLLGTFTPPGVRFTGDNYDPRIILIAAGRCNHAGVGEYRWGAPGGNGSSIGIEWCGPALEGMPPIVVELYERVVACILRNRNWTVEQDTTHWEYARPLGRKIDTSGPWEPQPDLGRTQPQHPDIWRGRIQQRLTTPTIPEDAVITEIDPAKSRVLDTREPNGPALGGNNASRVHDQLTVHAHRAGLPPNTKMVMVNITTTDPIADGFITCWSGGPKPLRAATTYRHADTRTGFTVVGLSRYGTFELAIGGNVPPSPTHVVVDVVAAIS